jgi:uncharacterized phiE125 gp8 family phage protein
MALVETTPPTTYPVSLSEVKSFLRIDGSDEDNDLNMFIAAATQQAQDFAGRQFVTATRTLYMDGFGDKNYLRNWAILIPRPPLSSVTSIKYLDSAGDEQTVTASNYRVDTKSQPGRITTIDSYSWPATQGVTGDVYIEYVCGYGAASSVPDTYRTAILQGIGHWYENREAAMPGSIATKTPFAWESLLWRERVIEL